MGSFRKTIIKEAWPHREREMKPALLVVKRQTRWLCNEMKQAFVSERLGYNYETGVPAEACALNKLCPHHCYPEGLKDMRRANHIRIIIVTEFRREPLRNRSR